MNVGSVPAGIVRTSLHCSTQHVQELPELAPVETIVELLDFIAGLPVEKQTIVLPLGAEGLRLTDPELDWGWYKPAVLKFSSGASCQVWPESSAGAIRCHDQNELSPLGAAVWAGAYNEANMLLSYSTDYWIKPLDLGIFSFLLKSTPFSSPDVSVLIGNLIGQITVLGATEGNSRPPILNPQWPPYYVSPRGALDMLYDILLKGDHWKSWLTEPQDAQHHQGSWNLCCFMEPNATFEIALATIPRIMPSVLSETAFSEEN